MSYLITSLTIVYSTVYSGTDQRKHQNSASLAFVRRIHRSLVTPPQCWKDVGRSTNLQFPYCWRACPFTMMMSVVSKAHRPGNAIMMAVNGLAPKGHQYTSEHHSESSAIPVYSSSLKPCYTTYIPHYSH